MKHSYFFTTILSLLFLWTGSTYGQAPAWQTLISAHPLPGGNYTLVSGTAVAPNGDVYLAGTFTGGIRLGSIDLTSAGAQDLFVAKWSPVTGSFVWGQRAGGTGGDYATSLAVNGTSLYITGEFASSAAVFGNTTLPWNGGRDMFVTKLTDNGTSAAFRWAKAVGSMGTDVGQAVAVNGNSVYVAGYSGGPVTFGSINVNPPGYSFGFVAKLLDAGSTANFMWVQQGSGIDGVTEASALAVNGSSVYVVGGMGSTTTTFGNTTLVNAGPVGTYDVFLAKLTDAGTTSSIAWARRVGGIDEEYSNAVTVSGSSVYVAGSFRSPTVAFGSTTLANVTASNTIADVFITKVTDAGNNSSFTWALRAGGIGGESVSAIATTGGAVYVGGQFTGAVTSFGNTTLTNASTNSREDLFVTRITDAGTSAGFTWAQRAGGMGEERILALTVSSGTVYIGGYLTPPASFGNLSVTSSVVAPTAYLASLADNVLLATIGQGSLPEITLYPNPAHLRTRVSVPALTGRTQVLLSVTDALGRVLRTHTAAKVPSTDFHYDLDLTGLAPGLYTLRVQAGSTYAVRQLAVE